MTLVIITGGIDISVGSLLALVVVSVGFGYDRGLPMPLAMMLGLLVGAAGGALNGGISTVLRLNPLVVTLGTLALYRDLARHQQRRGCVELSGLVRLYWPGQSRAGTVPAVHLYSSGDGICRDVALDIIRARCLRRRGQRNGDAVFW